MSLEIKKYDWVDALRGYAILMVIMIHTSLVFTTPYLFHRISLNMDLGVSLFFIVSSFTLFNSYKKRIVTDGKNASKYFFIRRIFRIVPIYYLAMLGYILISAFYHSMWVMPLDLSKILSNIFFLNSIYLPAINYLPPGSWSIGVEMMFYLTIPLLITKVKNTNQAMKLLLYSIIISFLLQVIIYYFIQNFTLFNWVKLRRWELYFWLPNQFPIFCFGILFYYFISFQQIIYKEWMLICSILGIIMLNIFNFSLNFPFFLIQREYLFSLAFCCFAFSISKTKYRFLIYPINKLGKVSFSAYLLHFILIDFSYRVLKKFSLYSSLDTNWKYLFLLILVVILTYLVSKFSYQYIELRGIKLGEKKIEQLKFKS